MVKSVPLVSKGWRTAPYAETGLPLLERYYYAPFHLKSHSLVPHSTVFILPLCQSGIVNKRQKSIKAVLAALKIEMGHPHITASASAALYPERQDGLTPVPVPIRRSNIAPKP
jgi:hypothetical protein